MDDHTTANGHANGHLTTGSSTRPYDVIVIGAGIAGIDAGYHIQTSLPNSSYTILEGRAELGGTWSFWKYPGVRSDSDLHTFGFPFNPWEAPNPIATGESIHAYLRETAEKFGIDKKIRLRHKVESADWSSEQQMWRLEVDNEGTRKVFWTKFVICGTGYYDYEKPLEAKIPGLENFKGQTVHPQFWPEDLDFKGKKMVLIGSGATAITILPAVVEQGVGHVTMLQRSPTYILNMAQKKPGQKTWHDYLPRWLALRLIRFEFILGAWLLYLFCRAFPKAAANIVRGEAKKVLPKDFVMDPHFFPKYNIWDQRLCFCPDADFFKCFGTGRAKIVTDTIKTVTEHGIELNSGERLDADIIVTATGLTLSFAGRIRLSVDKKPVHIPDHFLWRSSMLSGVPNLALVVGYVNASWTLGADAANRLTVRLLKFMQDNGYTYAVPKITPEEAKNPQTPMKLQSTYVKAATNKMPLTGNKGPWKPRDNYFKDWWLAKHADLRQGMEFGKVST